MEDKKFYQLEVTYTTKFGTATHRFQILAESKWEAIERALTRYRNIQPDRTYYTIVSGGWNREVARVICFLAVGAVNYSMNYS
jgi:hypothetical protein